ncbi:DUF4167 domain-containing protein [Amylibacter sp. IMCC11727]|uniref:DUF4167 domain-containing protein n=1 Tax=Amylibacter sp. IMCC11727 TaxID=3039851 RepID=UPI00244DEA3C|nr:DUF4167 domain-containing protein [Amylibacter sp. IMCC11727]WGI20765.1 DUF4167 domain-containing protein [Amylibacter sp. IMCC11727]
MRSSNKSRSRNKNRNRNNNNNNPANVVNRVFDSSGPEGKVRGTPQQIIDKYQTLARDAQLSGDRVAHENFLQHAEHYVRMLGDAQREIDARREQQDAQRQQNQQNHNQNNNNQNAQKQQQKQIPIDASGDQPSVPADADLFPAQNDSNLVETPESQPVKTEKKPAPRKRPAKPKIDNPSDIVAEAVENAESPKAAE